MFNIENFTYKAFEIVSLLSISVLVATASSIRITTENTVSMEMLSVVAVTALVAGYFHLAYSLPSSLKTSRKYLFLDKFSLILLLVNITYAVILFGPIKQMLTLDIYYLIFVFTVYFSLGRAGGQIMKHTVMMDLSSKE